MVAEFVDDAGAAAGGEDDEEDDLPANLTSVLVIIRPAALPQLSTSPTPSPADVRSLRPHHHCQPAALSHSTRLALRLTLLAYEACTACGCSSVLITAGQHTLPSSA